MIGVRCSTWKAFIPSKNYLKCRPCVRYLTMKNMADSLHRISSHFIRIIAGTWVRLIFCLDHPGGQAYRESPIILASFGGFGFGNSAFDNGSESSCTDRTFLVLNCRNSLSPRDPPLERRLSGQDAQIKIAKIDSLWE